MYPAEKYLIIGPSWVGDMVMAQTLFIFLKQQNPNCTIDVMAPKSTFALLARMPEISNGVEMPLGHGKLDIGARFRLGKTLRDKGYAKVLVLTNSWKSAIVPWAAKIAKRVGWRGEMRYLLLNDVRILDGRQYPLMIERFVALALPRGAELPKPLPKPLLQVTESAKQQALAKLNLDRDKSILALCPGAEFGPAKRWPEQYYAEVAKAKVAEGWQVWLFGSPKDQAVAADIQQVAGGVCVDITGKTSLGEAVDLLACADAVVTNDSGLMHVAAALNKDIVAVYGSSSPGFTPPLSDKAKILTLNLECSPCFERECPLGHLNCLKQLLPQQVLRALNESTDR